MRGLNRGYVIRRLGLYLLTIWLGATIIFIIPRLMPGDPVAGIIGRMMAQSGGVADSGEIIKAWRIRFGLDDPPLVQYIRYIGNTMRFDLNISLAFFPSRVDEMIGRALPWTIGLLAVATVISFIL